MVLLWTTKDGRKLKISDMETSHIENSLAMLEKKGFISPSILEGYLWSEPNGDAAQLAFQQELDAVLSRPVSPFIDAFKNELKKRQQLDEPF